MSRCQHARFAAAGSVLVASVLCAAGEVGIGSPAPDFTLHDQYDREFTLNQARGAVVLIVYSDRKGSEYVGAYAKAVRERFAQMSPQEMRIVRVADLSSVPKLLRGMVKRRFQDTAADGTPRRSILLDWNGQIGRLYGSVESKTNAYLTDQSGLLQYRSAGAASAHEIQEVLEAMERVLKKRSDCRD